MIRKLIRQNTAYTVTLPIGWIREKGLSSSDEVFVDEEGGALVISAERRGKSPVVEIELEKGIPHYYRIVIENQYLRGADVLEITFADERALEIIQEVVSNLIGFEITDQKKGFCRVGETASPTVEEFSTISSRLFGIVRYAQELMVEDLKENSFARMGVFDKMIDDTRRFSLFCRRAIHKAAIVSRTEEVFLDLLLERLVIVAYETYFLYQRLQELKGAGKLKKETVTLYEDASNLFELFSEMYARKHTRHFAAINDAWESIYFKRGQRLLQSSAEKDAMVVFHAMNLAKIIFLIAQPNTVLARATDPKRG